MAKNTRKQIPIRIYLNYMTIWRRASDDFRSVNGQIEYLLSLCVKQRKKNGKYVSDEIDEEMEIDLEDED